MTCVFSFPLRSFAQSFLLLVCLLWLPGTVQSQYYYNTPADVPISSFSYLAQPCNSYDFSISMNNMEQFVTGVEFYISIDSMTVTPGLVYMSGFGPVQPGDLMLTSAWATMSFFFLSPGRMWVTVRGIGTPSILNEVYPCQFELLSTTASCMNQYEIQPKVTSQPCQVMLATNLSDDLIEAVPFQLSPNPADQFIEVDYSREKGNLDLVRILDCTGQVVYESNQPPQSFPHRFSTLDLADGIYFMMLESESGQGLQKFMVTH